MKNYTVAILLLVLFLGMNSGWSQKLKFDNSPEKKLEMSVTKYSKNNQVPPPENERQAVPLVYGHIFGGMGFSYLSCPKVKDLIGDDFGIGIGLPTWSYGIRGGIKHIFQVEYNLGDAAHDFNNNSIIPDIPSEQIKMDYDTKDFQVKVNPLFWRCNTNRNGITKAFFLVLGTGTVEWKDENKDGFEGDSKIYGLEWAGISKNVSFSFSLKKYAIEFDKTILFNIPFDVKTKASDWICELKVGIGLGI